MASPEKRYRSLYADRPDGGDAAVVSNGADRHHKVTVSDLARIAEVGKKFQKAANARHCMLLTGPLGLSSDPRLATENSILVNCQERFGYPASAPSGSIIVVLDTPGGSLDSAYRILLYLGRFAETLRVYVPRQAKSAGTLIALGANELRMSPFAELGPLDTQIRDPRNPTERMSALDCYKSVDYVRTFGLETFKQTLWCLADETRGRVPLPELLKIAADFSLGGISPALSQVGALDFGAWGRSLNIGQSYAKEIAHRVTADMPRSEQIAERLVFGYTHHLFPIDITGAANIGLKPEAMTEAEYDSSMAVLEACHGGPYVGFLPEYQAEQRGSSVGQQKGDPDSGKSPQAEPEGAGP
jgi:hypothetical protein